MPETYDGTEGTDAANAGLSVLDGAEKWYRVWRGVNKTRDMIAHLKAWVQSELAGISLTWAAISGKPATFPPSAHTHSYIQAGAAVFGDGGGFWYTANPVNISGALYNPPGRSTPVTTSYVAAYLNNDGRLGATPSAAKYKRDIEPYEGSVLDLRAVTYILKDDELETVRLGIIADEADEIEPMLVVHEDREPESFKYELLAVALLKEVQRLAARVQELEDRA